MAGIANLKDFKRILPNKTTITSTIVFISVTELNRLEREKYISAWKRRSCEERQVVYKINLSVKL